MASLSFIVPAPFISVQLFNVEMNGFFILELSLEFLSGRLSQFKMAKTDNSSYLAIGCLPWDARRQSMCHTYISGLGFRTRYKSLRPETRTFPFEVVVKSQRDNKFQ